MSIFTKIQTYMSGPAVSSKTYFDFPKPTGKYAVGTQVFYVTDASRVDPETNKSRQLVLQAWFPALGKSDKPVSPYSYEMLKVLKKMCVQNGFAKNQVDHLDRIRTHAFSDVQILKDTSLYPVVVFAHGYGTVRGQYTALCEEIASQGYIVLMVMHTYATALTRFEDGTETRLMRRVNFELIENCLDDVKTMLEHAHSGVLKELSQYGDFNNIGIVGHSLGGIMASHLCRRDARVKAGISLDGALWGKDAMESFNKPFMFMIAPTFYQMFGDHEYLVIAGMTKEQFAISLETFCQQNGHGSCKIMVQNAEHNTFTDYAVLADFFKQVLGVQNIDFATGKIEGLKATEIIRTQICDFFDKHLKA